MGLAEEVIAYNGANLNREGAHASQAYPVFCLRRKWKNGNRVIVHKTGGRNDEQKAKILLAGRKGEYLEATPGKRGTVV